MTITVSSIISDIKRHLSIIGKRLYDKEGKNMFSNITTSTAEEPIFEQYISAAVKEVDSALLPIIVSHEITATNIVYELENTRGKYGDDFESHCEGYIKSFIVLYVVGRFLAMTHPDMAEKYTVDSSNAIMSLVQYAFYKEPPTAPTHHYPTELSVDEDSIDIGVGEECIIGYTIPDTCIDDIEISVEDNIIVDAGRTEKGIVVVGKLLGHTTVKLFSRHNETIYETIHVYVTDQS